MSDRQSKLISRKLSVEPVMDWTHQVEFTEICDYFLKI
jgi:hypothetical protein